MEGCAHRMLVLGEAALCHTCMVNLAFAGRRTLGPERQVLSLSSRLASALDISTDLQLSRSFVMVTTDYSRGELQRLAYETLSKCFQQHEDEVLEIEILSPAIHPPDGFLMQDGLNLGITKEGLVLAYLEARHRFFKDEDSHNTSSALQATKVMLLFDPEHVTAANFRKRRLLRMKAEYDSQTGSVFHRALRRELCLLNTILTSPLHRQAKSPTLWHHRLWILDPLVSIELKQASQDQEAAFWRAEVTAVCRSGEQHPKNYYAWQYARRVMSRVNSLNIHDAIAQQVRDWCCRHPSDISGWSFLLFLLPGLQPVSRRRDLIKNVLDYAINLGLEQESLWVFIRTALAQGYFHEQDAELYQMVQDYGNTLKEIDTASAKSDQVSRTLNWINVYGQSAAATKTCSLA